MTTTTLTGPWTFDEAVDKDRAASIAQAQAEEFLRHSYRDHATAEERYRKALAEEIVRQHADENVAWTVAPDLARGNGRVARLRAERDVAEGVVEAAKQASWRRAADRRAVERYATWSMRRELAEGGVGG